MRTAADRHKEIIGAYLHGEPVSDSQLWLSVGYFHAGSGRHLPKPVSPAEWERLLKETGRR